MSTNAPKVHLPGIEFVVSSDEIRSEDINSVLSGVKSVDCDDLNAYLAEQITSEESVRDNVMSLFAIITYFHFDPYCLSEPFKPIFVSGNARSPIPNDLLDEQISILADSAENIDNAGLRARVADIVWTQQRHRHEFADLAIHGYCDCIEQIHKGKSVMSFDESSATSTQATLLIVRAASISKLMKGQPKATCRLKAIVSDLLEDAVNGAVFEGYARLAVDSLKFDLANPRQIAIRAEQLAQNPAIANRTEVRHWLWQAATTGYEKTGDHADRDRCQNEMIRCMTVAADHADIPANRVTLLRETIKLARKNKGDPQQVSSLTTKLRTAQTQAIEQLSEQLYQFDLTECAAATVAAVSGSKLSELLLTVLEFTSPPPPEEARKNAEKALRKSPLLRFFEIEALDDKGRKQYGSPAMEGDKAKSSSHPKYVEHKHRQIERSVKVHGIIEPMRRVIAEEHSPLPIDRFQQMFHRSRFVPEDRASAFAQGLEQFLTGDNANASRTLFPELENSVRHVLNELGVDTTVPKRGGVEEDASVTYMLRKSSWQPQLEGALGPRYLQELRFLFEFRGGPSLRNRWGHGKLSDDDYGEDDSIYSTWLILHIAMQLLEPDINFVSSVLDG